MSVVDSLKIPITASFNTLPAQMNTVANIVGTAAARCAAPIAITLDTRSAESTMAKLRQAADATAKYVAQGTLASRVAPTLAAKASPVMAAKSAIDAGVPKAVDIAIRASSAMLKSDLTTATGILKAGVKTMERIALLPLSVSNLALKAGLAVGEGVLIVKIKEMTGLSWVQIGVSYVALKVGLNIAGRLVKGSISAMARTAIFPIRVGLGALKASLGAARSMVSGAVSAMGSVGPIGLAVGGIGAVAGISAALGKSVMDASSLNETLSKVGFVFKESSQVVIASSDQMAARFGLNKREFLDSASAIGLIGKGAGMTESKAADMGIAMSKLAIDASSFYNVPVSDALDKIRSGLIGESEPLRAFGVLLSEDAVKAEALARGLVKPKEALTSTALVAARMSLITKGLSDAQGDLARTSDSLANRLRETGGRITNLGATIGGYLLPAVKSLSSAFTGVVVGLTESIERNKAIFEGWAEKLRGAAEYAAIFVRHFAEFKQIANIAFGDLGSTLKAALDPLFAYMNDSARYFGQLLSRSIEDGVNAAIRSVTPSFGGMLATALGSIAVPGAEGFRPAPVAPPPDNRPPLAPPVWKGMDVKTNPAITGILDQINASEAHAKGGASADDFKLAKEGFARLTDEARQAAPTILSLAASFIQARKDAMAAINLRGDTPEKSGVSRAIPPFKDSTTTVARKAFEASRWIAEKDDVGISRLGRGHASGAAPTADFFGGTSPADLFSKEAEKFKTAKRGAAARISPGPAANDRPLAADLMGPSRGAAIGVAPPSAVETLNYQKTVAETEKEAAEERRQKELEQKTKRKTTPDFKVAQDASTATMLNAASAFNSTMFGAVGGMAGLGAPAIAAAQAPAARVMDTVAANPRSLADKSPMRFASLVEKGSKEDYSAIIRNASGASGKSGDAGQQTAKNTAESNRLLKQLVTQNGKPGPGNARVPFPLA